MRTEYSIYQQALDLSPSPIFILTYPELSTTYSNPAAKKIHDKILHGIKKEVQTAASKSTTSETQVQRDDSSYRINFLDEANSKAVLVQIDQSTDYSLYDSLPVMITMRSDSGAFHNKAYLKYTGQQLSTASYRRAIHPEDRKEFDDLLKGNSDQLTHSHRLRSAAGSYRNVTTIATTRGQQKIFITTDAHDLYEVAERLTEKVSALETVQAENQRLIDTENSAREGNRLKGEFLANTSHEIRTPIAGVIGMVDLLLDTSLDDEQKDYAESIRSSADALLTVINDVLDFSKIEAGKMQIDKRSFELTQMVKDIETMLSFMTSHKGLGLSVELDPGPCYLLGDRGRVRQILTNLLSNAIKFTQKGSVGLIVKHEEETDDYVKIRFSVTDTGSGMSQETVDNLFRPFAQGDAGRTYGGTGLGLSICKKLVQLMDGDIGSETKLGEGTTFWFWLKFPRTSGVSKSSSNSQSRPSELSSRSNSTVAMTGNELTAEALEKNSEQSELPQRPSNIYDRSISTDSIMTLRVHEDAEDVEDYDALSDDAVPDISESGSGQMPDLPPFNNAEAAGTSTDDSAQSSVIGFELPSRSPKDFLRKGSVTSSSTATTESKDKRILLAEDNEINCKIATSMLRKLGYACTVVKNGQQAVDAIDEQSAFDLVLMDVQMPVLNGYEATQLIRQSPNEAMRSIPVIALTASAVSGDREKCLSAGMDDYLTKPVNQKNLEKKLRKWLLLE